jgi:hypothetical protein
VEFREAHQIAADILAPKTPGDPNLLNWRLAQKLTEVSNLARRVGAELQSRQMVAFVVYEWQRANMGERAYGDGFKLG